MAALFSGLQDYNTIYPWYGYPLMFLQHLHLRHFRNYTDQTVTFTAPKTLVVGDNAQGKSNLLEAVELLASLRSHRVSRDRDLVQDSHDSGDITAFLQRDLGFYKVGLTLRVSGRRTALLNTETLRRQLDLLGTLNAVQFSSLDLDLVRGGPGQRRDWIDGLLMQLEPVAAHLLQQYGRVLRQRNALLRQDLPGVNRGNRLGKGGQGLAQGSAMDHSLFPDDQALAQEAWGAEASPGWDDGSADPLSPTSELALWDAQLASLGTQVMRRRQRALHRLAPLAQQWHQRISGCRELLRIQYLPNVSGDQPDLLDNPDYLQALFLDRMGDRSAAERSQGNSLVGPHRDEVELWINDTPARHYGSQGQQRTVVLAIKLAELELLETVIGEPPVLLLDDVLAELDLKRQNQLLEAIDDRFQTLITTTHLGAFDAHWRRDSQILTVEGGQVI